MTAMQALPVLQEQALKNQRVFLLDQVAGPGIELVFQSG